MADDQKWDHRVATERDAERGMERHGSGGVADRSSSISIVAGPEPMKNLSKKKRKEKKRKEKKKTQTQTQTKTNNQIDRLRAGQELLGTAASSTSGGERERRGRLLKFFHVRDAADSDPSVR